MAYVDGLTFTFTQEDDIADYEDQVESQYQGYRVVYDYRSDGEVAVRYRADKLKVAQAALQSNDAFLLLPFTTALQNVEIVWTTRLWKWSYRQLRCKYCGAAARGHIEVAIRKVIGYRRPPKGAREMKVSLDPFYVFRAKRMTSHCAKCGLENEN